MEIMRTFLVHNIFYSGEHKSAENLKDFLGLLTQTIDQNSLCSPDIVSAHLLLNYLGHLL